MPALKPLPSVARIAANRTNAEKSTGPRTEEGKARSRENALKHGLTGEGIALPTEDRARVEGRFAGLRAELGPSTVLGAHFAGKVALMTVRAERAARQESAALAHRVRHAAEAYDRERREEAGAWLDRLGEEPVAARGELLRTPEGVDALTEALLDLRATLNRPKPEWSPEHEAHYEACHGRRVGDRVVARGLTLSRALLGDPGLLASGDRDPAAAGKPPIRTWIAGLIGEIDLEVDRLAAHRATLDHDAIAADRAGAADRALFDPGRDATLARRYEAASTRELYRALDEFRAAEAAGPAQIPAPESRPARPAAPIEGPATVAAKPHSCKGLIAPMGSSGARPIPGHVPTVTGGRPGAVAGEFGARERPGAVPAGASC